MKLEAWQENLLEVLEIVSDISLQERAWINRERFLPDPTELICQIFDNSALFESDERSQKLIQLFSKEAQDNLIYLDQLERQIDVDLYTVNPEELLKNESWIRFAHHCKITRDSLIKSLESNRN